MAKIASDQDKPDGYYVIGASEAREWLARVQPACYSGWKIANGQITGSRASKLRRYSLPEGRQRALLGSTLAGWLTTMELTAPGCTA